MKIYGIDFTSAPSWKKPITCASGRFKRGKILFVEQVDALPNFDDFEKFLDSPGPWVAGMDFPFGLPGSFLDAVSLPEKWNEYVQVIAARDRDDFEKKIRKFQGRKKNGNKEPLRITDGLSQAKSPLKLVNPPVGKMFFEGASRLLNSKVSVLPCRPRNDNRIAVETYPALIARRMATVYKSDGSKGNWKEMEDARRDILEGLRKGDLADDLGFEVQFEESLLSQAVGDSKGDILDAILCCLQAGWAHKNRRKAYGIANINHPTICSEGWIVGPELSCGSRVRIKNKSGFAELSEKEPSYSKVSAEGLISHVKRLAEIGRALSGEMSLASLLEKIVTGSRILTNADGGTLYVIDEDKLHFKVVQNESLNIRMGGDSGVDLSFSALDMEATNVSAYAALSGSTVNIPDVYDCKPFNFAGPKKFDKRMGYRTKSMLVAPLINCEGAVIGVLQLVNARSADAENRVVPFSEDYAVLVESLASQAAVAISNAGLIDDLHAANSQLLSARDEVSEANKSKSTFVANISHELKTPMNAIIGYSEILLEDAHDGPMAGFEDDLGKIHSSAKHLLNLINEILDLSKIESGKMDINVQSFKIEEMVNEAIVQIKPLAEKNSNKLMIECRNGIGSMSADRFRVSQILVNLLSNACKFTENGRVTLSVRREHIGAIDWILFAVEDTGIGIAPEERGKSFAEFSQVDTSRSRKFGGTGLGLSTSLRFCRMMGGDIILKSTPAEGSVFTVKLPAKVIPVLKPLRRTSDRIRH